LNNTFSATPASTPLKPARKQWYDKLADALLGDDEEDVGAGRAGSRYALICEKCFAHNGLVKESIWEDTRK
jgi:endoplasmic reticulum junction formation protein lunapark